MARTFIVPDAECLFGLHFGSGRPKKIGPPVVTLTALKVNVFFGRITHRFAEHWYHLSMFRATKIQPTSTGSLKTGEYASRRRQWWG